MTSRRVVLISGADGGLGRTVADAFARSGAAVVGVSRSIEARDGLRAVRADLTTAAGAAEAVRQTVETEGRLDAVVHLMGGFAGGQPLGGTNDETWHKMMGLNLHAAFYVFRAAVPHLTPGGRLLAVSSRAAVQPSPNYSAYAVSKAALNALVVTLAAELKSARVTVNAVMPSIIDTPTNRRDMPNADFSNWVKPQAIADLLLYLASAEAQDVSGALIPLYGGA